jgi:hypothetical protein
MLKRYLAIQEVGKREWVGDVRMKEKRIEKNPDIFVEEMDTEILLYQPNSNKAIHHNETAALVWKLCDGTRTVQDLIDVVSESFPDENDLAYEIEQIIDFLVNEGALSAEA